MSSSLIYPPDLNMGYIYLAEVHCGCHTGIKIGSTKKNIYDRVQCACRFYQGMSWLLAYGLCRSPLKTEDVIHRILHHMGYGVIGAEFSNSREYYNPCKIPYEILLNVVKTICVSLIEVEHFDFVLGKQRYNSVFPNQLNDLATKMKGEQK